MENGELSEKIPVGGKKIVLAGNPNVGKSVIFNALTGLYVDVSNYSGTTLDMACGRYGSDVVIDTPGVYGISALNEEEKVTRDIILSADVVVNVVNTVHLERDLFLTLQIIDMGYPLIVALNMVDEAGLEGLEIDVSGLEEMLGVPVIPTVAVTGAGIGELKKMISFARPGCVDPLVLEQVGKIHPLVGRAESLLVLEGDLEVSQRCGLQPGTGRDIIYQARRERVNRIVAQVVKEYGGVAHFAARLGRKMLQPATGFPLLALTLWGVYELVGVFFAQFVVDFTENLMMGYYEPAIRSLLSGFIPPGSVLITILAGQYGLFTLTVTYLIGLLLPLVLGIFLVLSILEDSGYLPRIATLTDRTLIGIGLNGQAVIPLILGFGCVTMACITTRLLGSDRERRIAIFLLALGVPCSAQLAINVAVLAGLGAAYAALYILITFSIVIITGTLLSRFLPGGPSPLLIELPPLRLPRPKNVLTKTWIRTSQFIREAFPIFAAGTLFLSIMEVTGLLQQLRNILKPVTVSWLHLPPEVADIFIMGFIRKEFGAAAILSIQMLPLQKFVVMITLSLTVPCIAATMIIFKERGWREGLAIWLTVFSLAFLIGGVLTRFLEFVSPSGVIHVPALFAVIVLLLAALLVFSKIFPPAKEH